MKLFEHLSLEADTPNETPVSVPNELEPKTPEVLQRPELIETNVDLVLDDVQRGIQTAKSSLESASLGSIRTLKKLHRRIQDMAKGTLYRKPELDLAFGRSVAQEEFSQSEFSEKLKDITESHIMAGYTDRNAELLIEMHVRIQTTVLGQLQDELKSLNSKLKDIVSVIKDRQMPEEVSAMCDEEYMHEAFGHLGKTLTHDEVLNYTEYLMARIQGYSYLCKDLALGVTSRIGNYVDTPSAKLIEDAANIINKANTIYALNEPKLKYGIENFIYGQHLAIVKDLSNGANVPLVVKTEPREGGKYKSYYVNCTELLRIVEWMTASVQALKSAFGSLNIPLTENREYLDSLKEGTRIQLLNAIHQLSVFGLVGVETVFTWVKYINGNLTQLKKYID